MPSVFGKDTKKKELLHGLADIFASLQHQHQISAGDFPNVQRMQEQLQYHDFSKFPLLKPKLLETVDRMLADDIARLMTMIPKEEEQRVDAAVVKVLFFAATSVHARREENELNIKNLTRNQYASPPRGNAIPAGQGHARYPFSDSYNILCCWGILLFPRFVQISTS